MSAQTVVRLKFDGRRTTTLLAIAAATAIAILISLNLVVFTRDPSQSYPLFLIVIALAAWQVGTRFGYATVAVSALALAYLNLEGEGFAVSNPHDAVGLINLIAAGLLCVQLIDRMKTRLAITEHGQRAAETNAAAQAALVSEIAHRVMNDLGALSALATLRARSTSAEETRTALEAMADRMRFLGSVYRRLNVAGAANTDARLFLSGLCDDLRAAHLGVRPVSIELQAHQVEMPFSQVALVGLVLNESVTNALKYAFPGNRAGKIVVRLEREAQDAVWRLAVSDDGVGPSGNGPEGTGLGIKLIRSIAAQLHGSYELQRQNGLTISCLSFTPTEPMLRANHVSSFEEPRHAVHAR